MPRHNQPSEGEPTQGLSSQDLPTQSYSAFDPAGPPLTRPQPQAFTQPAPQPPAFARPEPQPLPPPQPFAQPEPEAQAQPKPRMSRRFLLRGAAGAGVVGVAAAVGAGSAMAVTRDSPKLKPVSEPVWKAPMAPSAMEGPLVVYINDTTTGEVDVFAGTGQMRMRNPALVRELLNNLK